MDAVDSPLLRRVAALLSGRHPRTQFKLRIEPGGALSSRFAESGAINVEWHEGASKTLVEQSLAELGECEADEPQLRWPVLLERHVMLPTQLALLLAVGREDERLREATERHCELVAAADPTGASALLDAAMWSEAHRQWPEHHTRIEALGYWQIMDWVGCEQLDPELLVISRLACELSGPGPDPFGTALTLAVDPTSCVHAALRASRAEGMAARTRQAP